MFAGAIGVASPSKAAKAGASVARRIPPGTDEVAAQGLQAAANMAVIGAGEFMEATVRQHGKNPAVALNKQQIDLQIQQNSKINKRNQ